jgi:hypothetical protein
MDTGFENYNTKTADQAERNVIPPILLLATTPDEIFQEMEFKDLNSFATGADIFIKILEKSSIFSDEKSKNEIQHYIQSLQVEYNSFFLKKVQGQGQKTDIDKIMRLYDLTDGAVVEDTLLSYGEQFRKAANTSAKQEQALSFERLIRFMYLKEMGGLEKLDEDTMQSDNKELL